MTQQYLDTWSNKRNTGKLSLLDRIKLARMRPEQTLVSGLDDGISMTWTGGGA